MPSPTVFNAATGQLVHGAPIADPTAGASIDTQARTVTNGILAALRSAGAIAGATSLPLTHQFSGPTARTVLGPAIADPAGGTPDADLRTAVVGVLTVLRNGGLINGGTAHPSISPRGFNGPNLQTTVGAAIADLSVATGDVNCRTAINSALAAMRSAALIA